MPSVSDSCSTCGGGGDSLDMSVGNAVTNVCTQLCSVRGTPAFGELCSTRAGPDPSELSLPSKAEFSLYHRLPGFCSTSFLTVDSDRQIQFQFSRSRSETQQLSRSLRPEQTMSVSMHQEGLPYSDTAIFKYWPTLLETSGADDDLNANLQHP